LFPWGPQRKPKVQKFNRGVPPKKALGVSSTLTFTTLIETLKGTQKVMEIRKFSLTQPEKKYFLFELKVVKNYKKLKPNGNS
jgi:hypothetical protein